VELDDLAPRHATQQDNQRLAAAAVGELGGVKSWVDEI
jgi:hypothetical protein